MAGRTGWQALSEQEWKSMKRKSKTASADRGESDYVAPPNKREKRKVSKKHEGLPWETVRIEAAITAQARRLAINSTIVCHAIDIGGR